MLIFAIVVRLVLLALDLVPKNRFLIFGTAGVILSSAIPSRGETKTLFWAEAVLETRDGKLIPLSELPASKTNVLPNPYSNTKDYADGRINISGQVYSWGLPAKPVNSGSDSPALYTFT